ncbi:MAG: hypothetical protein ACLTKL_00955 [Streptococcus salivarius]
MESTMMSGDNQQLKLIKLIQNGIIPPTQEQAALKAMPNAWEKTPIAVNDNTVYVYFTCK